MKKTTIHRTGDTSNGTLCGAKASNKTDNANKVTCQRCIKKLDAEVKTADLTTDLLNAATKATKPGAEDKDIKALQAKIKKNFASRVKYNMYMDEQIGIKQNWQVEMTSPFAVRAEGNAETGLITINVPGEKIGLITVDMDKIGDVMEHLGTVLFMDPTYFIRQDEKRAAKKARRIRPHASIYAPAKTKKS